MQFIDAAHISQSPLVNLMAFVTICKKSRECWCGCTQREWMQKSRRWQVGFELKQKLWSSPKCLIGVLFGLWKWLIECFGIQWGRFSLIFSALWGFRKEAHCDGLQQEIKVFYMLVDIILYNRHTQNEKSVKPAFLNRTCGRDFNARTAKMTIIEDWWIDDENNDTRIIWEFMFLSL